MPQIAIPIPIMDPKLPQLTEEEVFENGLPLPEEYKDTVLQTTEIGHLTTITNRDIGTASNGTLVYQGFDQDKRELAIKKVPIAMSKKIKKQLEVIKSDQHDNIINY